MFISIEVGVLYPKKRGSLLYLNTKNIFNAGADFACILTDSFLYTQQTQG